MIDVGSNMSGIRPLRIECQKQNVGKISNAGEFACKKTGPKRGVWPFSFNSVMDSTKMEKGMIENFPLIG